MQGTLFICFSLIVDFASAGFNSDLDPNHHNCTCDLEQNFYYYPICWPRDYNKNKPPSKNHKVFLNVALATQNTSVINYNDLKHIDVHKMMIIYVPKLVMSWQDPRLKFCPMQPTLLDVLALNGSWIPRITIENHAGKKTDFKDPAKISKLSCV